MTEIERLRQEVRTLRAERNELIDWLRRVYLASDDGDWRYSRARASNRP